jgi:NAD(P)H-hydrate epimerase
MEYVFKKYKRYMRYLLCSIPARKTLNQNMKSQAITSEQMYKIEDNGHRILGMKRLLMMENAGHGTADILLREFDSTIKSKKIVAICGGGNNGGDAFVACRHLAASGVIDISVVLLTPPGEIRTPEAKTNWTILKKMKSIKVMSPRNSALSNLDQFFEREIKGADIILDGLFGTGIKGKIREPYSSAIDRINKSNAFVLAVDLPSGLDPNTGNASNKCIKANATITFHKMKKGLKLAKKYTGRIQVERIGIPPEAENGVLT